MGRARLYTIVCVTRIVSPSAHSQNAKVLRTVISTVGAVGVDIVVEMYVVCIQVSLSTAPRKFCHTMSVSSPSPVSCAASSYASSYLSLRIHVSSSLV